MVFCNTCERLFKGQAGLTLHCRRAYPVDFHNEHQVLPRVKARWAPEEVRRMAEFESSLLLSGVKPIAINSQLVEKFPDRSRESIKGERKKDSYKQLVTDLVLGGTVAVSNSRTPERSLREDEIPMDRDLWRREMLDSINILLDKRGDPREEPLWDSLQLAVYSLGAETVDMSGVKSCLNQHAALLVDLFAKPPRRVRKRARKSGHKFATPSSEGAETAETDGGKINRKRKPNPARIARIQAYARVQEAFRSDGKSVQEMVLEGKWGQETA